MEKNKIVAYILILLALLFGLKQTAYATVVPEDYTPSSQTYHLDSYEQKYGDNVFRFYLGSEGVTDHNGVLHSFVADSVLLDLDVKFNLTDFTISDYASDYDFLYLDICDYFDYTMTYTDYGNGLNTVQQEVVSVQPYFIVNGQKHYLAQASYNTIDLGRIQTDTTGQFGIEFQLLINYSGNGSSSSTPREFYGYTSFSIHTVSTIIDLYGCQIVSTGDAAIVDTLSNMLWQIECAVVNMNNRLYDLISGIDSKLNMLYQDMSQPLSDIALNVGTYLPNLAEKLDALILALEGNGNIADDESDLGVLIGSMADSITDAIYTAIDGLTSKVVYHGTYIGEAIFMLPELLSDYIYESMLNVKFSIVDSIRAIKDSTLVK